MRRVASAVMPESIAGTPISATLVCSRALLGEAGTTGAVDEAGNLAAPLLAQTVGGGAGSVGGDAFLAIIAAVAFATILAVVAGLVISASGAVAHDVWSNVIRKGRDSEKEEVHVARIAAFAIGAIAIAIVGGSDLNVSYMVGLAFAVAASANFPALLLALTWRRFNTTGAVTGVPLGTVSSVGLVLLGPDVRTSDPLIELTQPAIISVPLGFLGCIIGSLLSRDETKAEREFDELHVRAETGLGAEVPLERPAEAPTPPPRTRRREPVAAMSEHRHHRT
ncbi:MAG TPA: hypothetical protein VFY37_09800 [Solirubrobacterales bacterium]|nr:hypothetical protein [Solirubrobacterales bacterium]